MIRTPEELFARAAVCKELLDSKFNGSDGKIYLMICGGGGCVASGALKLEEECNRLIKEKGLEEKVAVRKVGCFGLCSQGPFIRVFPKDVLYRLVKQGDIEEIIEKDVIGGEIVERLLYVDPKTGEKIAKQDQIPFYKKQKKIALHGCGVINPESFDEALGCGAYQGLANALKMTPQEVVTNVLESGLRGRGGGGFLTGRKWQFAYNQDSKEKYVVCNGDEGDPGAFMDRSILEDNPLAVIEGMTIAGYAIGASEGYFYVRAEYPTAVKRLRHAIEMAEAQGLLGDDILGSGFSFRAHIRLGAGAFVCGEETALLHSIQGLRGMPRPRPPFPAVRGLWDKPTIVNNVETLATVPYILRNGVEEFTKYGTTGSKGTKVFALGGKVNNVGLVEVPMGTTLRELVYDIGGGIPNDKKFKAIQTGGPSGGCITADELDVSIDFDNLVALGSMMGSGGAIVMDEDNCMVDVAKFYMEFICDESCGKCSPCRIGTKRMLEILTKITEGEATMQDLEDLETIGNACQSNSLCSLGQSAANPVISTLASFYDEYLAHIQDKHCPAHVCKNLTIYSIDAEKCKRCSLCAKKCPVGAISGIVGKTNFVIDPDVCVRCGLCISSCKFGAISKEQ
ncbi:MAG: 4Fe-4S binding protein [Oscillospiraceae bacterium]|nr:4Fe-4S binding protein [Oscillospiraceae bacterium]